MFACARACVCVRLCTGAWPLAARQLESLFRVTSRRPCCVQIEVSSGCSTEEYLASLKFGLEVSWQEFKEKFGRLPSIVYYNAGTDILNGDPLGKINVSPKGRLRIPRASQSQRTPVLGVPCAKLPAVGGAQRRHLRMACGSPCREMRPVRQV
jgi:hypothetical protein